MPLPYFCYPLIKIIKYEKCYGSNGSIAIADGMQ